MSSVLQVQQFYTAGTPLSEAYCQWPIIELAMNVSPKNKTAASHVVPTQSPNFRIIWGTRFSTKEPEVQWALSALVPSEDSQSIRVKKSVRRSRDRTKWWFTVMAPEDTLATLENSWSVTECNMTWKLQKSLRQSGTPSEAGDATQASTSEGAVSPSLWRG